MELEDYDLNISRDLFLYIQSSYPFLRSAKRVGKDNFIGYNHKIRNQDIDLETITPVRARDLFYKDIKDIENYTLIKSIKNKIDNTMYEVLVHFCFDYGKNVLKNSKFYFYMKQNNKNKVLEELEKYKTHNNTLCKKNISKRNFDINLINNGTYKNKETNNGNKKRSSSKNVGFRF